jgi:ABC-type antimicrobial peptide transport system permease subunit
MAPVWFALCAGMRRRWRALVSLALLLGLAGGVVLTAAAGARRTDTAYPRLLAWAGASQVTVTLGGLDPAYFTALNQLPQVAAVATGMQYNIALPVPGGLPDSQVQVLASSNGSLGTAVDRVKVLQGRMFGPGTAGEAVIDPGTAARLHLAPGDTLHLTAIPYLQNQEMDPSKLQVPLTFRVTAVGLFDDQVVPTTGTSSEPRILLSPGFTRTAMASRAYGSKGSIDYLAQADVRLRPGADPAAFTAAAQALASRYPGVRANGGLVFIDSSAQVTGTERAIGPLAVTLALFAALAGLIALAVIGQLLARQMTLDAAGYGALSALGMTRGGLLALAAARLALVTAAGGVIAVGIAIAASPLMPIGAARLAEPQPGSDRDPTVLGAGFAAVVLLPLVMLTAPAIRAVRQARGAAGAAGQPAARPAPRPSWLAGALTRAGTVTGGIGTRMAFEPGHGRTAVPVRSALAGTAIAVAAVVAAAVFGTSLVGLVSSPRQYGQNWNQQLSLGFVAVPSSYAAQLAAAAPGVTGYALGDIGQLSIGGTRVAAVGVDSVHGDEYLTMLAGRPPANAGEIALGAQTMRALGVRTGQTVRATVDWATGHPGPATQRLLRVTGTVVLPDFGQSGLSSDTDLGNGAVVSPSLLSAPQQIPGCTSARDTCYSLLLFRYRPGTELPAAQTALLAAAAKAGCPYGACTVTADQRPGDIKNYDAIRDTPLALAAILGLLAVGTLAHVLLTGVRRRRRDLAVLKTLGFTRWEVLRTVAWEASALAAAALAVGIPLGVIAGRVAWALFADATGIASQATVNVPLVLLAIPATLLLANVIAAWPGWTAARLRPAQVLRTE